MSTARRSRRQKSSASRGMNDSAPSEYELARLARIKSNQAKLVSLGLAGGVVPVRVARTAAAQDLKRKRRPSGSQRQLRKERAIPRQGSRKSKRLRGVRAVSFRNGGSELTKEQRAQMAREEEKRLAREAKDRKAAEQALLKRWKSELGVARSKLSSLPSSSRQL